ncbi:MAG TPA: hypothetical protein VF773_07385 [Verrucomicrobiae bacterium]
MRKILIGTAAVASALLIGCAESGDYGQGSSATTESGASASSTAVSEPGVASESGNVGTVGNRAENKSPETQFNNLGSASAPSANVPANVATNGTSAGQNVEVDQSGESSVGAQVSSQNEQGVQGAEATPEPNTGDDQNPDNVKPENE